MTSNDEEKVSVLHARLRTLEGFDEKLLERPEIAHLPSVLEEGELPGSVVQSTASAILVATDRRVIHIEKSLWGKSIKRVRSYLYSDIRSCRADMGFFGLGLSMRTSEGVKTLNANKKSRLTFSNFVRHHLGDEPQSESALKSSSGSKRDIALGFTILGVLGALVVGVVFGALWIFGGDSEPSEDRLNGFHCLSSWDGNHDGLERLVKPLLNDPNSMETFKTHIGRVSNGEHRIIMEFGARNAFGGMVRMTAYGWVDHEDCTATLDYIDE